MGRHEFQTLTREPVTRVDDCQMRHHPVENGGSIGCLVIPPSATRFWIASFTRLTAFNLPEKACENTALAPTLLTQPQTPESMNKSVEAAAHDRVKYLLTIK